MNADDFQELYMLLRGSKSALPVLDAKAFYLDKKMVAALEKLTYAREGFYESRSRLLKQDPEKQVDPKAKDADKQIKKLQRKKDKLLEILKVFDELLPQLQKLADRAIARQAEIEAEEEAKAEAVSLSTASEESFEPAGDLDSPDGLEVAKRSDLSDAFSREFAESAGDQRLDVVMAQFGFRQVDSDNDLHGESLYLIQSKPSSFLVCTPPLEEMRESVALTNVADDRPIKPFTRAQFLDFGKRRKMVLLIRKEAVTSEEASENTELEIEPTDSGENGTTNPAAEQSILDVGAFSQLLTSAQRCGLVPGADQIGYVRDREFRMGKYDLAFQAIDSMFSKFMASATQRAQQLTREDADIASGRLKMSPKQLQAKRASDRRQTQEVDRAKRRFQVVVEGLRVLMKTNSQPTAADGSTSS